MPRSCKFRNFRRSGPDGPTAKRSSSGVRGSAVSCSRKALGGCAGRTASSDGRSGAASSGTGTAVERIGQGTGASSLSRRGPIRCPDPADCVVDRGYLVFSGFAPISTAAREHAAARSERVVTGQRGSGCSTRVRSSRARSAREVGGPWRALRALREADCGTECACAEPAGAFLALGRGPPRSPRTSTRDGL